MATRTEVERLSVVETKIDGVVSDVKEIKASILALDKKFASKWVQTIVSGFVAAILLTFAYVIINFFIPSKPVVNQPTTSTSSQTTTDKGSSENTGNPGETQNSTNSRSTTTSTTKESSAGSGTTETGLKINLPKLR